MPRLSGRLFVLVAVLALLAAAPAEPRADRRGDRPPGEREDQKRRVIAGRSDRDRHERQCGRLGGRQEHRRLEEVRVAQS